MKLSITVALVLLCSLLHPGLTGPLPTSVRQTTLPCLNICYVMDSSGSPSAFEDQKGFAQLIGSIYSAGTGNAVRYGAVMGLADGNEKISGMKKLNGFTSKLLATTQPDPAPAGVKYKKAMRKCRNLMDKKPALVNAIVLFGFNPPLDTTQATNFAADWAAAGSHNTVYAISGAADNAPYVAITGDAVRVRGLDGFFELADLLGNSVASTCTL